MLIKLYLLLAEERGWKVKGSIVRAPEGKKARPPKRRPENAPLPKKKIKENRQDKSEWFWKMIRPTSIDQ